MSSLNQKFTNLTPFQILLEQTSPLNKCAPHPLWLALAGLYASPELFLRILACVCNSAATHRTDTFLLSGRSLEKLIQNDANLSRKTLSGGEANFFFALAKQEGHLTLLKPPSKCGGAGARAGLYKLEVQEVLDYLSSEPAQAPAENAPTQPDIILVSDQVERDLRERQETELRKSFGME